MKKLLLITLTLTSYFVNAQNIQAYSDATIDGRGFSYNVQLSIIPLENNEVTQSGGWIVKIISVNPDSKGYYHKGKTDRYFSCSELGSICNPSKFNVILVKVKYQCENNAEKLITFYGLDREQTIVVRQKPNTKCNIELESVTVRNNTDGDIYHKRINELEYPQQNTSTTNNNLPSSNYSNPIAKENKQTSTGMPANTSGNDPLKHFETDGKTYTNPMSNNTNSGSSAVDNFNKGYQQGQQIAEITTGIVSLFTPSPEQIQRREQAEAEYERQKKIEKDLAFEKRKIDDHSRFDIIYLPLMDKAIKGDENARMILYYASYHLLSTEKVRKRYEWIREAYNNKNPDAYMEVANVEKDKGNDWISPTRDAANVGSVDAMLRLASWYDYNIPYGGGNAKLALEWYTRAAQKGSPNAMFYLGMIYKYGIIEDLSTGGIVGFRKKMHVKYDVLKDEKKAFEWFEKSNQPNYVISMFALSNKTIIENYTDLSSYFNKNTYYQLSLIYKKGEIVPKDKVKAEELMRLYESYGSHYNKYNF